MNTLDERGAAAILNCSPALLKRMRRDRRGPRWTRVGRLVRYPEAWLLDFVEANAEPRPASFQTGEKA
jgi:hypothetical protein